MKLFAAIVALAMLLVPVTALALPSIVGNFQGWDPADPASEVTLNGNGVYTLTISAGDSLHIYKAVDGDAWGDDFPGSDQTFTPGSPQSVTFFVNLGAVPGTKQGDEFVFHSLNPPIVAGSMQSELGGTDWDQTDTVTTAMSDGDLDDVWEFSSVIPVGTYECKIVLNNNWDQSTGGNVPFGSDGVNPVTFKYYMATNVTEVISAAAPTVISAPIDYDGTDAGLLSVQFSKDMEQTSAETEANYTISGGPGGSYPVGTATLDGSDASLVHLDLVSPLVEGYDYAVTVTGVTDLALTPVDPTANLACFYLHRVDFEINMSLYGVPTTLHIQGDTHPLTWDQCGGAEMLDADADTTYAVTEYFTMHSAPVGGTCEANAESTLVKYKYVVDCTTWEGDFEFGHTVTLDPNSASQLASVWWEDIAPVDNIACDVGVLFQVHDAPVCPAGLFVRGTELPLDWSTGVELLDDGTGGDVTASDGIYSAEVVFPTGTYKFLGYKYFCADSDTTGTYECDTLPDRALTLDDVDGCVGTRVGPMELTDLWNWCEPVTGINIEPMSWGQIKNLYKRD